MASPLSDDQQQELVSSFLEVADDQSPEAARQFLEATGWRLNDALQLLRAGNGGGGLAPSSSSSTSGATPSGRESDVAADDDDPCVEDDESEASDDDGFDEYDDGTENLDDDLSDGAQASSNEELECSDGWEPGYAESSSNDSNDSMDFDTMSFYEVKEEAALRNKWLLANLQCTKGFHSNMLNLDAWSKEPVAQVIQTNFIFWQVDGDTYEGKKVCNYYSLLSLPASLLIDPITGQKMCAWSGMVQPEQLFEDLLPFMDEGPKEHLVAHQRPLNVIGYFGGTGTSMDATEDATRQLFGNDEEDNETDEKGSSAGKYAYIPLPEEPKGSRELLCRVGIRFPNGMRLQRNFLRADPVKLLWSFCSCQLGEGDACQFRLLQAIPGKTRRLDYESDLTFGESGLANSMITLTFE